MAELKDGDRVAIVDREATADDVKSGLFYNHFRGLTGAIQKVYATDEVAVEVDLECLSDPIVGRHNDVQEAMKARWLDGLSEEARNRLTDRERDFRLRYSVLVHKRDLAPTGERKPIAPKPTAQVAALEAPRRLTSVEIDAREAEEIRRRTERPQE